MTGRELFAFNNHEGLLGAARQRALDTNNKSPAGVYQTILKEHWDALSDDDQANWNQLADAQGGDVGRIQVHSVHNHVHFGGTPEELELHHGKPWADFADKAIPRPLILNPSIPRNSNNQPVFPTIVMDTIPIADMRLLLCDYLEQFGDVPWEAITSDPAKYYNVEAAYFSIKLDHPQNLSTIGVLTLVEGLLATSVITSPNPFQFAQEKVLPPETPPPALQDDPAPSRSPSPDVPKSPSPPPTPVLETPTVETPEKELKDRSKPGGDPRNLARGLRSAPRARGAVRALLCLTVFFANLLGGRLRLRHVTMSQPDLLSLLVTGWAAPRSE
ncbi:hypothetical protein B0H10DRAFT_2224404 [Mycena sp. CBHHK59/15]|nr:hypothetical protein B0H10DRAFT_2224404 [Mycena sp. CBHHK59/15]